MNVTRSISAVRSALEPARRAGASIGFVPTLGALHDGHVSLLRAARSASDEVVASIFVNPLQFGPAEDLEAYPRPEEHDLELLRAEKVDVAFLPPREEMYPPDASTTVQVRGISEVLEGARRPGHFDGVCTVLAKLFNIVAPTYAFFGQKDAQQVAVVKRMTADLDLPVEIVVEPTVREPDGLALSSRNAYLSPADRNRATVLYRALEAGRHAYESSNDPARAEDRMTEKFRDEGIRPDYAVACDPESFGAPQPGRRILLVVAARIGPARLIDNMPVEPRA